jgi:hypothetical protein
LFGSRVDWNSLFDAMYWSGAGLLMLWAAEAAAR